jgi:uncharacterized protein YegP (UPF0339 family)
MRAKGYVYQDKKSEWRWKVVAANGRVLADSGEGYKRRANCLKGFFATRQAFLTDVMGDELDDE